MTMTVTLLDDETLKIVKEFVAEKLKDNISPEMIIAIAELIKAVR